MPERKKIVYVQSVLPMDVVLDLKKKTGESSIHQAITKAVYHYLNCEKEKEAGRPATKW